MPMPFETTKERRLSPTGIGRTVVQHVDIETITREMAVPTDAIARRAIEQGLPLEPAATERSHQEDNTRNGYV